MKNIVLVLMATLLLCGTLTNLSEAAPFLVSDPQVGVTQYKFTGDTFFTTISAQSDGSLRYDLVGIPTGVHNLNVTASNVWGDSAAVPFSFTKSVPGAPLNLRLSSH